MHITNVNMGYYRKTSNEEIEGFEKQFCPEETKTYEKWSASKKEKILRVLRTIVILDPIRWRRKTNSVKHEGSSWV